MTNTTHSGGPEPTDTSPEKNILLLCRSAPYGGALARETLETALAAGAMGYSVSLLFLDEGVWQLLDNQKPIAIHTKNHQAMLGALPLYEVDKLFVERSSLTQRQLNKRDINPGVTVLDTTEIKGLFQSSDCILSF
ncbi:MAG TPA: sulfurtransferase complex subunit TusC [Porticoccaceae bacterium]|nr:sulfurtransferase complex subunit TusC [Porticoccaceae bacterium]